MKIIYANSEIQEFVIYQLHVISSSSKTCVLVCGGGGGFRVLWTDNCYFTFVVFFDHFFFVVMDSEFLVL